MNIGDKIHYSGDMANDSGWFTVSRVRDDGSVDLAEVTPDVASSRTWKQVTHVGNKYSGHCDPRFVTEAAVLAYRAR